MLNYRLRSEAESNIILDSFKPIKEDQAMKKYICKVCGHVYDPANNNNVPFEDLPDDWTCPVCGVGKDQFEEM